MTQEIKPNVFLDLNDELKVRISSVPPSPSDNPELSVGCNVLVMTTESKALNFKIVLEVVEKRYGQWVGKVIGAEDYEGPRETIYPDEYFKFEFNDISADDLYYFEDKNVDSVFKIS